MPNNPTLLILSSTFLYLISFSSHVYLPTSQKYYAYHFIHTRTNKNKDDLLSILGSLFILQSWICLHPLNLRSLFKASTCQDKLLPSIVNNLDQLTWRQDWDHHLILLHLIHHHYLTVAIVIYNDEVPWSMLQHCHMVQQVGNPH